MATKNKMAAKKQNGRQNTKLMIIHSISKLKVQDFAWLLILTLHKIFSKPRWPPKNKIATKNKMAAKDKMAAKTQN